MIIIIVIKALTINPVDADTFKDGDNEHTEGSTVVVH